MSEIKHITNSCRRGEEMGFMEDLAFMYIQSKNANSQPILRRVYKKEYVARRASGESAAEIMEEKQPTHRRNKWTKKKL